MTLIEAFNSHQKFKRPHWTGFMQYYAPGTGPRSRLVSCDYFIITDVDDMPLNTEFSTSIDLYAADIMADDYILIPD